MITQLKIVASIISFFLVYSGIPFGKYSYKTNYYFESLELKANNQFVFLSKQEFISYEIKGNYYTRNNGDSLVLDSNPHRDKIIVSESNQGEQESITIAVTNKTGDLIHYSLFLILKNEKIVSLDDQWDKSIINAEKLKAFYLIDSKGLKSPTYYVKGEFSNYFKVQFETKRVFENETWYIKDNKIYPRGLNGEIQNYFLEKYD